MNEKTHRKVSRPVFHHAGGMTLLEVLLAIVIFVVGMLALLHLQGNLARSSTDANSRTVATNIAEETIEGMRVFQQIATDPAGIKKAYDDIVSSTKTITRGNSNYTLETVVTEYYFLPDRVTVSATPPASVTASDFKHVELAISWVGNEFEVDEGTQSTGRLGSGSFNVSSIIPAIPSLGTAKVAVEDDEGVGSPPVPYKPGLNPDIVAIQLDTNKFKESTTPEPVVRRSDELIETWFDVITYSTSNTGAIFVRREEFASVSCDCTLRAPSGSGEDGREPTLWTGAEYAEGLEVGKYYGEAADKRQSQYCEVCCQDHHDTGGGNVSYRPLMSPFSGDHPHYFRDRNGDLTPATNDGDDYTEACRLVRKDGFFRVAQDFSLKSQTTFPENYLDSSSEVKEYSNYVMTSVSHHFQNPTAAWPVHSLAFDGRNPGNPTDLPTKINLPTRLAGSVEQQLRSRGIYTDVITPALQANIDNCFGFAGDPTKCEVPGATNVMEIYPFFDVQLTKLARWSETRPNDPVDVSNEELDDRNPYSRGMAALAGSKLGMSQTHSIIEDGNVGLISTLPVAAVPTPAYSTADLYVRAGDVTTPPPPSGVEVTGSLSNQGGTSDAAAAVIVGDGANCGKPTNSTFLCVIEPGASFPTITISNYVKAKTNLIACSDELTMTAFTVGVTAASNSTTFLLPVEPTSGITITISKQPC